MLAAQLSSLLLLTQQLQLQQPRLQHPHRALPIAPQRPLVLAGDHDVRRQVGDPHRRRVLLHVLPPVARGAVDIDLQIIVVDLDRVYLFNLRQHVHLGERGVARVLLIERRDPHQPMHAVLGAQPAVRRFPFHLQRRRLDPGLVALHPVDQLGRELRALRPAQIHSLQHLRPVLRLHAARAGANLYDRIPLVVGPRKGQLERLLLDLRGDRPYFLLQLGRQRRVVVRRRQLHELRRLIRAALQAAPDIDRPLPRRQTPHLRARALRVVPEVRRRGLPLQRRCFPLQRRQVKDAPACRSAARAAPSTRSVGRPWRRISSASPAYQRRPQATGRSRVAVRFQRTRFGAAPVLCPEHHALAARAMRAARVTLFSSIATVIGPTPPGTGVMNPARSRTLSKSTSPTRR